MKAIKFAIMAAFMIPAIAQETAPTAKIFPILLYLRSLSDVALPEPFEVKNETPFTSQAFNGPPLLAASEIRMRPGSKLILAGPFSNVGGAERAIVIYVPSIVVLPAEPGEPNLPPPVITWLNKNGRTSAPPPVGKAALGLYGPIAGANGTSGGSGLRGNTGFSGASAPSVYLVVSSIKGGNIQIDLRGQDGGVGGEGQAGGEGGAGAEGAVGSPGLLDCRRGPGDGGDGGAGGNGGPGGPGGRGGDGGSLYLITPGAGLNETIKSITFLGKSGKPGLGGAGGKAGLGGKGGSPGPSSGLCQGGARPGKMGTAGTAGLNGTPGELGFDGKWNSFTLTPENEIGITRGQGK